MSARVPARFAASPALPLRVWTDAICVALWVTAIGLSIGGRPTAAIPLALISATATFARFARASVVPESVFVTLLATDAWLTCSGLMAQINREDVAGHLVLPAAVTPMLAAVVRRIFPAARPSLAWVVVVGLGTVALAVGWEVVEASSDRLLGTNMSLSTADTVQDLICGVVGAAAGAAIAARIWPSGC